MPEAGLRCSTWDAMLTARNRGDLAEQVEREALTTPVWFAPALTSTGSCARFNDAATQMNRDVIYRFSGLSSVD